MRRDEPATMMHLIRPLLLLLGVVVLLLIAERAIGDSLRIHDVSGSDGPDIMLAQVAELEGDYASGFGQIVVGRFEDDAVRVEIQASAILEAIRAEGAKLGRLDLSGFGTCTVHRTFSGSAEAEPDESEPAVTNIEARATQPVTVYTPTTVRALIEAAITEAIGVEPGALEITFSDRDNELLNSSAVAGRFEIEPVVVPQLGAVSFKVYAYRGTRQVGDGRVVSARVRQRVIAVIAGDTIRRDTLINRRQVRLREVLIDDPQQAYLVDTALVTGQVASRTLKPGELITASEVQLPIAVRRRERVSVELNTRGVRITFNGIAQDQGAVGDTIEVLNPQTNERFNATVTGRGKVEAGEPTTQETGAVES